MTRKITVLIVDDSALVRQMLSTILNGDDDIEVVGTAQDALHARELIKRLNPDVVTLDVEMPKMNGIDFLKKIMTLRPMPVVMVSSLTQNGADITLRALEIGAVDFVGKPKIDADGTLEDKASEIIAKVKNAALAKIRPYGVVAQSKPIQSSQPMERSAYKAVVVGASTGGVEALRTVLSSLPATMPPIFVVQHMPKTFTRAFADRLDSLCAMKVQEAEDYMVAQPGNVYIAPGDRHLRLTRSKGEIICRVMDGNPVSGHIPSVDVLFESACHVNPSETIGVMLTGMGKDGAESMLKMKEAGAFNIGQDEQSCVVYGMPKAAFVKGAIDRQADLNKIGEELVSLCFEKGAQHV